MASRRKQSDAAMDQPVQFYKFIALTFLFLTLILAATVVFMSSKRADITITTRITPIDITAEATISEKDTFGHVRGTVSKETYTAEVSGAPEGTTTVIGTAEGTVTLHNNSATAQPLVATTRLITEDEILFRLRDRVVVPANGTLEDVAVYADEEGAVYDIEPTSFVIPGLNASRQKEVYATSETAMSGGLREVGAVSNEDIDRARKKLEEALIAQATQVAQAIEGTELLFIVDDLKTNGEEFLGRELDAFTLSGTGNVVTIAYDTGAMKKWADQQLLKRAIGDSELIRSADGDPQVTIQTFDAETGQATATVFYEGVVSLNPESKQIEKAAFFGKSKDEVRRYLLTLDHVHSIDMQFRPAWMRSVPHIPDHVSVVVKEIE